MVLVDVLFKQANRVIDCCKIAVNSLVHFRHDEENDVEQNASKGRGSLKRQHVNPVSMFWYDHALITLDIVQLHGLFWLLGQSWGLPMAWQKLSAPSLLFNLDAWALATFYGKYSSYDFGAFVAYIFLSMLAVVLVAVLLLPQFALWHVFDPKHARYERNFWYLVGGELVFLPALLLVFRSSICIDTDPSDHNWPIELSPTLQCKSGAHWGSMIMTLPWSIPVVSYVPWHLWNRVSQMVIYRQNKEHEQFLCLKEIEYLFQLRAEWMTDHFRHASSFKLHAAHYRLFSLGRKALFALVAFGLQKYPSIQGIILAWFAALWAFATILKPPFRCVASNRFSMAAELAFAFELYLGSLYACSVRSWMTSSHIMSRVLFFLNLGTLIFCITFLPLLAREDLKRKLPFSLEQQSITASAVSAQIWPTNARTLRKILASTDAVTWIRSIHEANQHLVSTYFTPDLVFPVHKTLALARQIETHWRAAEYGAKRLRGGGALREGGPVYHLLRYSLRETLDDLYATADSKHASSIFPNEKLEPLLERLATETSRRDREMILMAPQKKRILRKIQTLGLWSSKELVQRESLLPEAVLSAERDQLARAALKFLARQDDGNNDLPSTTKEATMKMDRWLRQLRQYPSQTKESLLASAELEKALASTFL